MNMRLLALLFLPVITIQADGRLGFATHFQQGWNADAMVPKIVASGAGMIRDDIGWWNCEPSKGTYTMRSSDVHWISAAGQAGLVDPNGDWAPRVAESVTLKSDRFIVDVPAASVAVVQIHTG
jgi:hypothetical protein